MPASSDKEELTEEAEDETDLTVTVTVSRRSDLLAACFFDDFLREEDAEEDADLDERWEVCLAEARDGGWEPELGLGLVEVIGRAMRLGPVGHHEVWAISSTPLPMQAGVY